MRPYVEEAADTTFADVGIGPFHQSEGENHLAKAAVVFASGDPAVGFACVEVVDGAAHIWQLSVHPQAGRRGRARALVSAVCDWATAGGLPAVTLTTFRDVARVSAVARSRPTDPHHGAGRTGRPVGFRIGSSVGIIGS